MDFSQEISDFKKTGKYDYQFDDGGNLVFNESSPDFNYHFVSIPLRNYKYDNVKILSFYDLNFEEFISTKVQTEDSSTVSPEMEQLQLQNKSLQDQLVNLTSIADINQTAADVLATKQVIINLRVQLGQGASERDFSTTFPYLPNTKKTS